MFNIIINSKLNQCSHAINQLISNAKHINKIEEDLTSLSNIFNDYGYVITYGDGVA